MQMARNQELEEKLVFSHGFQEREVRYQGY